MSKITVIYQKKITGVILDDGRSFIYIQINDNGNKIERIQHPESKTVTEGDVQLVKAALGK